MKCQMWYIIVNIKDVLHTEIRQIVNNEIKSKCKMLLHGMKLYILLSAILATFFHGWHQTKIPPSWNWLKTNLTKHNGYMRTILILFEDIHVHVY